MHDTFSIIAIGGYFFGVVLAAIILLRWNKLAPGHFHPAEYLYCILSWIFIYLIVEAAEQDDSADL